MSQFDISLIETVVTFLLGGLMGWIACEVLVADRLREKLTALVAKWRKIIAECPVEHEKRWRDVFEAVETCASELEAAAREPGASERK